MDVFDLDDEALGQWFEALYFDAVAQELPDFSTPSSPQGRMAYLQQLDSTNAEDIALEKALFKAASGQYQQAGALFRSHMMQQGRLHAAVREAECGRLRQREKASRSRLDALQAQIHAIAEQNPTVTLRELESSLEKLATDDAEVGITYLDDEEIAWTDKHGNPKVTLRSGLKDRLSRAKKKLKSR